MKTYCLLLLDFHGKNKHGCYIASGSFAPVDGKEKPVLFLSVEDAEIFADKVLHRGKQLHPCRWG